MLPEKFRKYFWDTKFEELSWDEYYVYITKRLLMFGDDEAVKFIRSKLSEEQILEIVNTSREVDRKTKNYWNKILGN